MYLPSRVNAKNAAPLAVLGLGTVLIWPRFLVLVSFVVMLCLYDLLARWEDDYWDTVKANTKLFPEAEKVLEVLNSQYTVALITNTQGQTTHRISQFPELEKYFKVVIVAGEGGIPPKPDLQPFRMCMEELSLDPSEAVYVGDDYRIDICGARDAGLHPIWLKHHLVKRNWPDVETSAPVISSLDELLELEKLFPETAQR